MNISVRDSAASPERDLTSAEMLVAAIAAKPPGAGNQTDRLLALLDEAFAGILGENDFHLLLTQAAYHTGMAGDDFEGRRWIRWAQSGERSVDMVKIVQRFLDDLAVVIGSHFVTSRLERCLEKL